jgi:hypothetical protein
VSGGRIAVLSAAALLLAVGCDRAAPPEEAPSEAPVPAEPAADALPDTALTAVVRRTGERSYVLYGRTGAARTLQVTVEDGHYVLFGPVEVPVQGGDFRLEMTVGESGMSSVFAYVSDPEGLHQWVIPIPDGAERVHWGPGAERLQEPAA